MDEKIIGAMKPTKIDIMDLWKQLPKLLERTRFGECYTIVEQGTPVARLLTPGKEIVFQNLVRELQSIRSRTKKGPETLREMIDEKKRHSFDP